MEKNQRLTVIKKKVTIKPADKNSETKNNQYRDKYQYNYALLVGLGNPTPDSEIIIITLVLRL